MRTLDHDVVAKEGRKVGDDEGGGERHMEIRRFACTKLRGSTESALL